MEQTVTLAGIGHNRGPELDGEFGWRKHAWTKARAALLPVLPIEVIRSRVRRASELGLDYRTYAGVRAQTGRDVIGFLFSTNALGLLRASDRAPTSIAARLATLAADRTALVRAPLDPALIRNLLPLDAAHAAPRFTDSWGQSRDRIAAILRDRGLHPASVLLIAETAEERDWVAAGRLAGCLDGARYFAAA